MGEWLSTPTASAISERDIIEISQLLNSGCSVADPPSSTLPIVGLGLLLPVEYGGKALVEAFPLELHVQTCQLKNVSIRLPPSSIAIVSLTAADTSPSCPIPTAPTSLPHR